MSGESTGPTLLGPNGHSLRPPKTDVHGRVLKHNATIQEVYEIVAEECAKVHEFYLNQIPAYTARMIQDALLGYGMIKLTDEATGALATVEAPVVPENAGGDTTAPDTTTPESAAEGPSGLLATDADDPTI